MANKTREKTRSIQSKATTLTVEKRLEIIEKILNKHYTGAFRELVNQAFVPEDEET